MTNQCLNILLVEDRLAQVELIQEFLADASDTQFEITAVHRLADGLKFLSDRSFDLILLDLWLPDSQGLETLKQAKDTVPTLPIIVLTSINDRALAIEAVRQDAQDYLVKGQFDGELLVRAINYAIERQRVKAELQQQIERERLMGRMLEQIRQSLNLDTILQTTVEEVRRFLNSDRVLIYRCQAGHPIDLVAESKGKTDCYDRAGAIDQLPPILEREETKADNSPSVKPGDLDEIFDSLVKSVLTVPIWQTQAGNKTHLWGQLIAQHDRESRQWQKWEIEFLTQLGNQVAIAIKQSELYQEVQRLATIDGLTGVANRRQFERTLAKEWKGLAREQKPFSLILCDIDFFKHYNDTYGHLQGDDCLKQVAGVLDRETKRPCDLVSRYGGEEFAIILPNTQANGALAVAQRIQRQLAILGIPHQASRVSQFITLSIGIATQIPQHGCPPSTLVEAADRALLQAKAEGRDRIRSSLGNSDSSNCLKVQYSIEEIDSSPEI